MTESLAYVTFVVREYDEAIDFFTRVLEFSLLEDSALPGGKRWVVVAPGANRTGLLLARAATPVQQRAIGNHAGGRVAFFLHTDDFQRRYDRLRERGVEFIAAPRSEPYGTVAVFLDLYGNRWDLVEPRSAARRLHEG
jgi:catechol 2,3-dioxygenase-like lactoylglutathione lyase family enzyme